MLKTTNGCVQELGPQGLRLVRLPASELGSIDELGRTLRQHPRMRFVVLCDPFTFSASSAAAVVSALSGLLLSHWWSPVVLIYDSVLLAG